MWIQNLRQGLFYAAKHGKHLILQPHASKLTDNRVVAEGAICLVGSPWSARFDTDASKCGVQILMARWQEVHAEFVRRKVAA